MVRVASCHYFFKLVPQHMTKKVELVLFLLNNESIQRSESVSQRNAIALWCLHWPRMTGSLSRSLLLSRRQMGWYGIDVNQAINWNWSDKTKQSMMASKRFWWQVEVWKQVQTKARNNIDNSKWISLIQPLNAIDTPGCIDHSGWIKREKPGQFVVRETGGWDA